MRLRSAIVPVLLMYCVVSSANANEGRGGAPRVPAPDEADPLLLSNDIKGSEARSAAERTAFFKLNVSSLGNSSRARQDAARIGFTRLSPALLSRPVEVKIDSNEPVIAAGLPASMARLELELDGNKYQLYFRNEVTDSRNELRHVVMSVLNDASAAARFTVGRDGRVYGVLRSKQGAYIFEPSGSPGEQVVYRYPNSRAIDDQRNKLIGNSPIAKRHHQLEALAEIRPEYSYSDNYSTYVIGGNLGGVASISAAAFVRAAERLSSITQFTGTENFELLTSRRTQDGGHHAVFRQRVDGIPVHSVNEMVVGPGGRILRLTTSLVPADVAATRPLLSMHDATAKTLLEWNARYGKAASSLRHEAEVNVEYRFDRTALTLDPFFGFAFSIDGELARFYVTVDAVSGRVELTDITSKNANYTSCDDLAVPYPPGGPPGPMPPINNCTRPNALKGYAFPDQTGYCSETGSYSSPSHCATDSAKVVAEVLGDIRSTLPGAIAMNAPGTPPCCTEMTDIIVIQKSRMPNLGSSSVLNTVVLMPTAESGSAEILGHELGHVYTNIYNNNALEVDTNVFAGAVREGASDTFSGLLGAITGRTARYGTLWQYGDGGSFSGTPRSASNSSFQYWQDITASAGAHASGQVISRFFRRLQEITGISNQRLLGIVAGTIAASQDLEGNGYDAGDFKRAVRSTIKSDETALQNALEQVYQELYRADAAGPGGTVPLPPGDPGPVGSPPITPSVWGAFNGCGYRDGVYVTVFDMYWTATADTAHYFGWLKATADAAFKFGVQTFSPHAFVFTNISGEARVSSCNGYGCSGMSNSRLLVSHTCGN